MDSVTQFALGAAVSTALLGRHIGARKAALLGGAMGTVPDLDTFFKFNDPLEAFTRHRGPTHSLLVQLAATPFFAEPLARIVGDLKDHRIKTYLAIYLVFATHALVDAMTVYGTRLLWPLVDEPFGVGSIFIIDPIYTLPLLIITLMAAFKGDWTERFARQTKLALIISTAYMGLSAGLQTHAHSKAMDWLAAHNVESSKTLTIPNPFNILFWRTIVIGDGHYLNLYASIFDDDFKAYRYPVRDDLRPCLAKISTFQELNGFSKGFTGVTIEDGKVVVSDLRMGLTPQYVFRFHLADLTGDRLTKSAIPARQKVIRGAEGDYDWLLSGILGSQMIRPREQTAYIGDPSTFTKFAEFQSSNCQMG